MAADEKLYIRGGFHGTFTGCLGVCLGFSNPTTYKEIYSTFVNSKFPDIIRKTGRKTIKSTDIAAELWTRRDIFLEELSQFVRNLHESGIIINVVYSTFNPQKLPEKIKLYGKDRSPEEEIDVLSYINILQNYYPYIAAWKVSKTAQLHGAEVYLDQFSFSSISNAWTELCAHHTVRIYPHGDLCNPFISSADIVTRYIDEYLFKNRLYLDESGIDQALKACGVADNHIFYVGHPDLQNIVPLTRIEINYRDYYPHPMIFLLRANIIPNEVQFIENMPIWARLTNYANDINGSVKFLDFQKDSKYIRSGDVLVYFDSESEKKGQYIQNMGDGILLKSIKDI